MAPNRKIRNRPSKPDGLHSGFTLVELLIALALGLFMTLAVVQSYLMTKRTYQTTQQVGRVQENARFGLHFVSKALREAGGRGCIDELRNMLNNSTSYNFSEPIVGWGLQWYKCRRQLCNPK